MQGNFSLQKIWHFLNQRGYGYSNQRGLIESCKDGRVLLKIVTDLLKQCELSWIRSILATSAYRVGENMDNHKNSLPSISDVIVVAEIFKITRMDVRLHDFIKPTNDRIISVLSHIYSLLGWEKKVNNLNENLLAKVKIMKNDFAKVRDQISHIEKELTQVQAMKAREKPKFLELSSQYTALKTQISHSKNFKSEKNSTKYLKQKTKSDLKHQTEQTSYQNQVISLQINQAKMKLSHNAPQIKKQKLRQDATLFQSNKQQQNKDNFYDGLSKTCKNQFENLQKSKMKQFMKSKEYTQNVNVNFQSKNEIDCGINSYRGQKSNVDIFYQKLAQHQELFDDEEERENVLNGDVAQKYIIQEDYKRKSVKHKNQMISQHKSIAFFENMRRTTFEDLDKKMKNIQELIQRNETQLAQIQFKTNQWNEQLFSTIKRVNQYYNPEQN